VYIYVFDAKAGDAFKNIYILNLKVNIGNPIKKSRETRFVSRAPAHALTLVAPPE